MAARDPAMTSNAPDLDGKLPAAPLAAARTFP
jgi:hypothetical protein